MEKSIKKEMIPVYKLLKIAPNAKMSIIVMITYLVLGCAMSIQYTITDNVLGLYLDYGAILLYATALFPAQLLFGICNSKMVRSAACAKRLQTSAPACLTFACNLTVMFLLLAIRVVAANVMPNQAEKIWNNLLPDGILCILMNIMAVMLYKYYVPTMIVFIMSIVLVNSRGIITENGLAKTLPVPVVIVFCLAAVFLGAGIQYLLSLALYKRPFSRLAFGSGYEKKFL